MAPVVNLLFLRWLPLVLVVVVITVVLVTFLSHRDSRARRLGCFLAAELAPIAFITLYLLFSRWPSRIFTGVSDYASFIIALFVGVTCLALSPLRLWVRVVASLVYIPLMFCFLAGYTLSFLCGVFHECL